MPILAAEPDHFPDDLFDRTDWTPDADRQWWALYTRSRCEKELMRRLRVLQVPHYGPLIEKSHRSPKGRQIKSFVPLFTNYVFMYGDATQRHQALTTNCVSRDILVSDGEQLATDLGQLRRLIATGAPISPADHLEPGTRVRVRTGPLEGQEGVVVQRRGETHLLVAVRFLQQGATVQIDNYQVEKL
jgi:transcription antitermination factor NusG